jgi:endonuclease/exonuclease/phosphatase family metal-dependent hydrolase
VSAADAAGGTGAGSTGHRVSGADRGRVSGADRGPGADQGRGAAGTDADRSAGSGSGTDADSGPGSGGRAGTGARRARLRLVGWNISEGVPPDSPGRPVAEAIAADAGRFRPDVLALQEVPFEPDGGSALLDELAALLGMPHRLAYEYSPAMHIDGARAGLALLGRLPWRAQTRALLPNPGLRALRRGREIVSYDKGVLVGQVETAAGPLWIGTAHLHPFHYFDTTADDPAVRKVWQGLAEFLLALPAGPLVLSADLNTERRDVLLDALRERPLRGTNTAGTSAIGMNVDDILIGPQLRLLDSQARYGASDHALCSVEVEYGQ